MRRFLLVAMALLLAVGSTFAAEKEMKKPWLVKGELSYVLTSGNSDTETFGGRVSYGGDYAPNRYFANAGCLYGKTDDVKTTDRG